jgi:hypothetical protein
VPLSSYCIFRTEIDVEPDYLDTEFHMDVELMFSDLKKMKNSGDILGRPLDEEVEFDCA